MYLHVVLLRLCDLARTKTTNFLWDLYSMELTHAKMIPMGIKTDVFLKIDSGLDKPDNLHLGRNKCDLHVTLKFQRSVSSLLMNVVHAVWHAWHLDRFVSHERGLNRTPYSISVIPLSFPRPSTRSRSGHACSLGWRRYSSTLPEPPPCRQCHRRQYNVQPASVVPYERCRHCCWETVSDRSAYVHCSIAHPLPLSL